MLNTKRLLPAALAAMVATSTLAGVASAKDRDGDQDRRDTAALATMKVSLSQAISTAEQQSGGRAVGADIVQEKGASRIAVEVAGTQGIKTVLVDGMTGQVTATHDGEQDNEDND